LSLCITILLVVYIRFHFLDMALERDEGEYAYSAVQILNGKHPYLDFYNMKLPGVYYAYALIFSLFGKSITAVRAFIGVMCLYNAYLIGKISSKWFDNRTGLIAAAIYLWMSVGIPSQGIIANAEHFVVLFYLAHLDSLIQKKYLQAGILAALALLMKQHAAIILLFSFIFFIFEANKGIKKTDTLKTIAHLSIGFSIPVLLFLTSIYQNGAWAPFKFFVLDYGRAYSNIRKPDPFNFGYLHYILTQFSFWKWIAISAVLILVIKKTTAHKLKSEPNTYNQKAGYILLWLFLAYLAVLPGWYYRPHYFQYIFPPLAILTAIGFFLLRDLMAKVPFLGSQKIQSAIFTTMLLLGFADAYRGQYPVLEICKRNNRPDIIKYENQSLINLMYGDDNFQELTELGRYLKSESSSSDKIGMIANEPQVAFYAGLPLASGYLYSYAFQEKQIYAQQMLTQHLGELSKAKPRWFLLNNGFITTDSFTNKQRIEEWWSIFKKDYDLTGAISTKNQWEKQFSLSPDTSTNNNHFLLYRRK
jgi:Gpi18-like mannosyltransferase